MENNEEKKDRRKEEKVENFNLLVILIDFFVCVWCINYLIFRNNYGYRI